MKNNVHVIISIPFCFLAGFGQSLYSIENMVQKERGICFQPAFQAFSCGTQHSNTQFRFCDTLVLINHGPHPLPSIRDVTKTNHKSRSKSHLYFSPPCNLLTKRAFHIDSKLSLETLFCLRRI